MERGGSEVVYILSWVSQGHSQFQDLWFYPPGIPHHPLSPIATSLSTMKRALLLSMVASALAGALPPPSVSTTSQKVCSTLLGPIPIPFVPTIVTTAWTTQTSTVYSTPTLTQTVTPAPSTSTLTKTATTTSYVTCKTPRLVEILRLADHRSLCHVHGYHAEHHDRANSTRLHPYRFCQ